MSHLSAQAGRGTVPASLVHITAVHGYDGFAFGCRGPSLVLTLRVPRLPALDGGALWYSLQMACPALEGMHMPEAVDAADGRSAMDWLLAVWQRVQQTKGLPVFEIGRVLWTRGDEVQCLVPVGYYSHRQMVQVVTATLQWLHGHTADATAVAQKGAKVDEALQHAVHGLSQMATKGVNRVHFLKAAYDFGLPTMMLPGGVVQYGLGRRARWLDSTFTDETSTIAARLARNKHWASTLLAQAGLPVAPQVVVTDAVQAVQAAARLGYPVVVKPVDLDGGLGVAAGLDDEQELSEAFSAAKQHTGQVLIEKHIHGKDYRLVVFQGELIWTIERVPAGVWSDGQHTVSELVDRVNADRRRGIGPHSPLKKLTLDDEGLTLLQKQGFTARSVPQKGQFVRLRRVANVASGGEPVAANAQVHPDNARLAVRAAQALGLDLAGIDLLIDDISRSWRDCGPDVAICEVNGQPQLGQITAAHLHGQLLQKMVSGDGRIPIILVLGADHPVRWLVALAKTFEARGLCVGTAGEEGVHVGDELLIKQPLRLKDAGRMLALNRQVDAMVLAVTEDSVTNTGLPWARYDALVLAGQHWPRSSQVPEPQPPRWWLEMLLPACDGVVVAHSAAGLRVSGVNQITTAQWLEAAGSETDVAADVARLVLDRGVAMNSDQLLRA